MCWKYEIPCWTPTRRFPHFVPNYLMHPVKDGEYICDLISCLTMKVINGFERCAYKLKANGNFNKHISQWYWQMEIQNYHTNE